MTEVQYSGSRASSTAVANALVDAGYQVVSYTPTGPLDSTSFWVQARKAFPQQAVQSGLPRDFRAIITSTGTDLDLVEVPLGATLSVDSQGQLGVRSPSSPVVSPSLSMWRNQATGQPASVFTWDGTSTGFVDLIAFFQLNGSLLERVRIAEATEGTAIPLLVARDLETDEQYSFPLRQDTAFTPSAEGRVLGLSNLELREKYAAIGRAPLPDFNYTPFSQSVLRNGIELVGEEEQPKTPWYKKWWVWVLIVLALLLLGLLTIVMLQDDQQSADAPGGEVVEVEEPQEPEEEIEGTEQTEEPVTDGPEGDLSDLDGDLDGGVDGPEEGGTDAPGNETGDLEGEGETEEPGDGAAQTPDPQPVEPPTAEPSEPGFVWPWEPGFKWPWDPGFKWPWSKDEVLDGIENLKEQGLDGLEELKERVSGD